MHSRLNEITQTGLFTNIKHIGRIIIIIYHLHISDKKGRFATHFSTLNLNTDFNLYSIGIVQGV